MSILMDHPVRTAKMLNNKMSDKCATLLSALYRLTKEGTKYTNVGNEYLAWMCKCCVRTVERKIVEATQSGFLEYIQRRPTRLLSLTDAGRELCMC